MSVISTKTFCALVKFIPIKLSYSLSKFCYIKQLMCFSLLQMKMSVGLLQEI